MFFNILLVSCFCWVLVNADPVSFITKCHQRDEACLRESTRAAIAIFMQGIPQYNVESLDPMFFKTLDSSTQNLNFKFFDATAKGMKSCVPRKVTHDEANSKLFLSVVCDNTLEGQYEINGKLHNLAVHGHGKAYVKLNKAIFDFYLDVSTKQANDGKDHWNIDKWDFSFELTEKCVFSLDNVQTEDPVLAASAKQILGNMSNDIIMELGAIPFKAIIQRLMDGVQHFFEAVPVEDLSLD